MSIELNPVGVKCNMQCPYCYEEPMRDAGNFSPGYDLEAMKAALQKHNWKFSLHGGEPLLMPIKDLEEILRWGFEKHGSTGLQTNGTLITEDHLALFVKYRTHVGFSLDGPEELNDSRWMGSVQKTREATAKSLWALRRLCELKLDPSVIIALYRGNAVGAKLHKLIAWMEGLSAIGVKHVRLHPLEIDNPEVRRTMALTDDENVAAMIGIDQAVGHQLRLDVFKDIQVLLSGADQDATCIWNACDPYTTRAVQGVDGLGNATNCGRTNKDGINWLKAPTEGFERYIVLHNTPQEDGGCKGCRFFFACKGQCPGTAINGDWRNRSEQCRMWYKLMTYVEGTLKATPISISPLLPKLEAAMVEGWENGVNYSVYDALQIAQGKEPKRRRQNREHGDHWDAPDGYQHSDGVFDVHGDAGTTEMHGDSDR